MDLFCGVGGLSLGWMEGGKGRSMALMGAVDADVSLREAFAWNFPETRFLQHEFTDALESNEASVIAEGAGVRPGDIDVLLAGPPCQTFSAAGKRQLQRESWHAFHVCDFAEYMQPRIVLIENVPEFSRAEEGRLLGRVRVRLSGAGYATEVVHLSAVDFGAPQMRTRCFTLGVHKDLLWPGRQEFAAALVAATKPWLPADRDPTRQPTTTSEALDDLPALQAGDGEQAMTYTQPPKSVYQYYLRGVQTCLFNHAAGQHSPELLAAMATLKPGETPQDIPNHPLRRKDYFRGAYARLDPDKPSTTMTTQTQNAGSGRFTHYRDHRVLTVREVARLQGFPDRFRFFGTQADQRRHAGNAVPPLLVQAIKSAVLSLIDL